ncbi:MAG: dihydroorotate dehydrogenase electron transfer subunit [Firmicutes bacterium]|nr:dihydroorotate dehydrogenase electron transfer subunit [Bacillota bacterium]
MTATLKASRTKAAWVQEWAEVVAQTGDHDVYKLTLRAPEIARRAVAGQFVEVRPVAGRGSAAVDPLLRRPFSICEIRPDEGIITLIYRVVGRGTAVMASVTAGQELNVMGPLGHSFPDPATGRGMLVLVGGGLGIPPMVAAAARARAEAPDRCVTAILGARHVGFLAGAEELAATGVPAAIMTDDGSAGHQGFVTAPLKELLDAAGAGCEVWACGPEGMLMAVKELCRAAGAPCFVSVERHMACGFGACIGCTVPKSGEPGFWKACQDGPVFLAEEVELGG